MEKDFFSSLSLLLYLQFIEKPDIEEQKTGEDHASTFFKSILFSSLLYCPPLTPLLLPPPPLPTELQGNKSQPPPSPSSSPQLLHSSSRSALPSIKSTPIPQSSSDEFLGLGLGGGGGGAVSHYSIRMKTLLHEVFSQDANKEYETISAIIDVVGDQVWRKKKKKNSKKYIRTSSFQQLSRNPNILFSPLFPSLFSFFLSFFLHHRFPLRASILCC